MLRVEMFTTDGVKIIGSFMTAPAVDRVVVCLHMMPADRTHWLAFQSVLAEQRIASLAIDLRGHGESLFQGDQQLDYQMFSDVDHQKSRKDVDAAIQWLTQQGFPYGEIFLAGASIGANLALRALADDAHLAGAVLFSPGSDYRGVTILDAVRRLSMAQSLLVIASAEDDQESFDASHLLVEEAPVRRKQFIPLRLVGHGTDMLTADTSLAQTVAAWIRSE